MDYCRHQRTHACIHALARSLALFVLHRWMDRSTWLLLAFCPPVLSLHAYMDRQSVLRTCCWLDLLWVNCSTEERDRSWWAALRASSQPPVRRRRRRHRRRQGGAVVACGCRARPAATNKPAVCMYIFMSTCRMPVCCYRYYLGLYETVKFFCSFTP